MYKTIEAVYEKGILCSVDGPLPKTRTRVLVTVLGPARASVHSKRLSGLLRRKGILKHLKAEPVVIQRRIRDEW
jgi:hypothetical protein